MQSTLARSHCIPTPSVWPAVLAAALVLLTAPASDAAVVTFESVTIAPESCWNGGDGTGGFADGPAWFNNLYNPDWDYWEGFACSNRTDANETGYAAQYNAIPGGGQGGSSNYAVAFVGWEIVPTVTFASPQILAGLYVTNNCYAFYDMRDGSPFTRKFGGLSGDDPDWFLLTITGLDANDLPTGTVEFFLADFRFEDDSRDYILDSWAFVDLTSLGQIKSLRFALSSSDNGDFGMNTPAYFCLDTIIPQHAVSTFETVSLAWQSAWNGGDGTGGFADGPAWFNNLYSPDWDYWEGFACSNRTDANETGYAAQYNAIPGGGQGGSSNYAVAFVGWEIVPTVTFASPQILAGLYVTNNCYAFYDMRDGSPFTRKFGGPSGDDPDWFKLTITGLDANDLPTGTVEFFLADFRFEDDSRDYILDSWAFVDLTSLGQIKSLRFALSSSDNGDFGMNTPAYFCLDTIVSTVGQEERSPAASDENPVGDESCLDN